MGYIYERSLIPYLALICILASTPLTLPAQDILDVLDRQEEVSIFAQAIEDAGLATKLSSGGPYTIFVPTNKALQNMTSRLDRAGQAQLEGFIMNHIITGMATRRQITAMSKAPSLGGLVLEMHVSDNNDITINEVSVVEYNIRANNGVIHLIDGTLEE